MPTKYVGLGRVVEVPKPEDAMKVTKESEPEIRYPEETYNTLQMKGLKGIETDDEVDIVIKATATATGRGEGQYDNDPESEVRWVKFCFKEAKIAEKPERDEAEERLSHERTMRSKKMSELYG